LPATLSRRARIIAAVTPLLPVAAGLLALVAGVAILRTYGPRYRVARLLLTTPKVSVGEALAIAATGAARYVRVDGRIDSADEFEDAAHRPLVFRRTRFEARRRGRWQAFEDSRESVPFSISEGLDTIDVDAESLGDGLVVVVRESAGVAADVGDRAPATLPPATPVRAIIEQVSSVEHAIALGVPALGVPALGVRALGVPGLGVRAPAETAPAETAIAQTRSPRLTAGLGRPLVLTTLEVPEAIRVIGGAGRLRPWLAAACLAGGLALVIVGVAWAGIGSILAPALVLGADASPSRGPGSDTRSVGEGPGLVGDPLAAILLVAAIAIVAIVVTTVYVRATGGPSRDPREPKDTRPHS
jgi:hypothetical protein